MTNQQKTWGDLTDNTTEGTNFDLRGKKYFLRYPAVSEVEMLQDLMQSLEDAESVRKDSPEEYKQRTEDLEVFMYGLITPVDHDTDLREALKKENVKVYRNFNTMIQTELSLK